MTASKSKNTTQNKALADVLFPTEEQQQITESILQIPPEQRRLHTDSYDFTVSTLVDYLKTKRIRIPDYQRRYVWSDAQASRLIESLIIQCPIPIIYLNQEKDESLAVIDGNQRLTTLRRYLNNEFKLSGLTAYPELEGFNFYELDSRFQRHIENRTIRCLVILKETHPQVKFDVFERLNTGSVKLTSHELRHGIYYGDMILLCEQLAQNKHFSEVIYLRDNKRMKLEELILRFLALFFARDTYRKPLSGFLNTFADTHRTLDAATRSKFIDTFKQTSEIARTIYGNKAFSIFEASGTVLSRFNSALYDAEMIAASQLIGRPKLPSKTRVLELVSNLLANNPAFRKAVIQATSDEAQVKARCDILSQALAAL